MKRSLVICLAMVVPGAVFAQTIVNPNNPTGDFFTNAGTSNTGQAIGASGWYYNNVRNDGVVGVNTTYARSGQGSLFFRTNQGPGGNSSKADAEFFATASPNQNGNYGPTSSLGLLGNLTSLSYEWYRASGGTANSNYMPAIRLGVFDAASGASGYIVFEREYQQAGGTYVAATDTWVTENLFAGNSVRMWSTGNLPNNVNASNGPAQLYDARTLNQWRADFANYFVTTISVGVGSGWGTFEGAVDNITFGFGTAPATTYNFEAVPEPFTMMLGAGAAAAYVRRRRKTVRG